MESSVELYFCPDFLVMSKNKLWLILKFMTSQTGQQTTAVYMLHKILRSKGNETMKFG